MKRKQEHIMQFRTTSFLVVAIIFTGGFAYGEAQPGPNHEHLKIFDDYIGTWVKRGPLEEDTPFGNKGDVGTSTLTWSWGYNKNVVDWKWEFKYAGKRSGTKGTITWDSVKSKLVGAGVSSDGAVIHVTGSSGDAPLTSSVEFTNPDGTTGSQIETFTLHDANTMTLMITKRKGRPVTVDSPEYTFTRVKRPGRPTDSIPKKALNQLRFMVGKWETQITLNGVKAGTVTHERRWATGRQCLRMNWNAMEDGAPVNAFGVSGWNAATEEVVEHWYDSLGRYTTVHWPLDKMTKDTWNGTASRTYSDGTVEAGTCRLEKGKGQWIFTFSGKKNGEATSVRHITLKVD